MTIEIKGNWKKGFAYDVHTLSSTYLGIDERGHEQWDTTRSEMGQLVYDLKYRGDLSTVKAIVDRLDKYKGLETMNAIIPIPASRPRRVQPVLEIAKALGSRINVPVWTILQKKPGGAELKNIDESAQRQAKLQELMAIDTSHHAITGQNVLLLDDLYRSGATLRVATGLLYQAGVRNVAVLVMTKTRSNR